MTDLTKAKAALDGHSLAVCKGEQIKTFDGRGISPLVNAIEGGDLRGYSAADTVVGKAAALLMVKAGIVCAYAVNISMSAKAVFEAHNIYYEFTTAKIPTFAPWKKPWRKSTTPNRRIAQ